MHSAGFEGGRLRLRCSVTAALAVLVFLLDLLTPIGVASGVAYVAVIAVAAGTRRQRWVGIAAIVCSGLAIAGMWLSPPGPGQQYAWANRTLSVLLIWFFALVFVLRLRAERRFRIAVEAAPSGMIVCDRAGRIVLANERAVRMFGYRPDELADSSIEVLAPDRVRSSHARLRATYFANPGVRVLGTSGDVHGRRKDGSEFPVEIGLTPVPMDHGMLVLASVVDLSARRHAELQTERLAAIVRTSHDAITAVDLDGRLTAWNQGAERIYGWRADEVIGTPLRSIVPESRLAELEEIMARVRAGESIESLSTLRLHKDGRAVAVSISVTPIRTPTGRVVGASGIGRDITAQQRSDAMLREMTVALTNAMPGISLVDADERFEQANEPFARLFGRSPEALAGARWIEAFDADARPRAEAAFQEMLRQGKAELEIARGADDADGGDGVCVDVLLVRRLDDAGRFRGLHCFARDVTERRRSEARLASMASELEAANERLQRLADMDPLTGLENRRGLEQALRIECRRAARDGAAIAAILVDLDDFKAINERFGHAVGDCVLTEVARRIRVAARATDHVARIGGDEFLVVLPDTRVSEALQVGERVRRVVGGEPIGVGATAVRVSASCGVEALPDACESIAAILAVVRESLGRAKHGGKDRVETGVAPAPRREPVTVLLHDGELRAVYQPIYELTDRSVVGYELLSRGPRGWLEQPGEFLRASQREGILADVDLRCLHTCLRAIPALPSAGRVHLNLFPTTLMQAPVERILDAFATAPAGSRLCLELNESELIGDPGRLRPTLDRVRAQGVQLAIDDVGFGRSSLEALIVLEPEIVKVDRRYVRGLARDDGRRRALDRLVNVVGALRTQSIGEGIEAEEDLAALVSFGVRHGQGYLLGRPVEFGEPDARVSAW